MEYQGPASSASCTPTLVFDWDGTRRVLPGVPDAAGLCFAVQFHNHRSDPGASARFARFPEAGTGAGGVVAYSLAFKYMFL
eukprot:COSAG05_NODE_14636_length_391_cov_1.544521_2_plen_80_part_01